ncbi:MAG: HPr family phosphocarrier protein [Spirochaetales bacterium]|nr:HPr family phosphocarrier protein [Spirochaetales bacterium]
MKEQSVIVQNRAGIHARPAALLVQTAGNFKSSVYLEKGSEKVNGKSIMGVITLGAVFNTEITIIAEGADEEAAVEALVNLFNSKFQED